MFTMLNLGESHVGKTQSLSTLPGRSILFNFEPPDNLTSLRVPYQEELRLVEFWKRQQPIEKVLVIQYTGVPKEVSLLALPDPSKTKITAFIEDLNTMGKHLDEVDNLILETLAPFGDEVLDFVVASNGRKDTQIQDYKIAKYKIQAIFGSMMGNGKNVIVTGHLQSERDEITGRGKVSPNIWGRDLPASIPKMFGEVFQSVITSDGKGGIKYQWQTKPDAGGFLQFLGSRKFDDLPRHIDQDFAYLDQAAKQADAKAAAQARMYREAAKVAAI